MNGKHPFFAVFQREVTRIRTQWIYIFSTLLLPGIAFALMAVIFSSGVPRNLDIAIVDQDFTPFSREICRAVSATPIAKVAHRPQSETEAYQMMKKGKVHAFLVIPKDSQNKQKNHETVSVALYLDNTNIVTGGLIQNDIRNAISSLSDDIKINRALKKGKSKKQAKNLAKPLKFSEQILFNPYGSYSAFLLNGLLPLLLIVFVFLTFVLALGSELKYGTAGELMEYANNSILTALTGKMLPYTILFLLQAMLMNFILFHYAGAPLNGSFSFITASELLLILAYQMMAVVLIALTSNLRLSLSLGSAYTMMALTFAGLTFPLNGMPFAARLFSYIFPFRFWNESFIGQTMRGEPLIQSVEPLLALFIFIATGIAATPLLKKRFMNPEFYGKT